MNLQFAFGENPLWATPGMAKPADSLSIFMMAVDHKGCNAAEEGLMSLSEAFASVIVLVKRVGP